MNETYAPPIKKALGEIAILEEKRRAAETDAISYIRAARDFFAEEKIVTTFNEARPCSLTFELLGIKFLIETSFTYLLKGNEPDIDPQLVTSKVDVDLEGKTYHHELVRVLVGPAEEAPEFPPLLLGRLLKEIIERKIEVILYPQPPLTGNGYTASPWLPQAQPAA